MSQDLPGGELGMLQALASKNLRLSKRPRHTFVFPLALRAEAGADAVGLVALTVPEDLEAAERAGDGGQVVYARELFKHSVRTLYKFKPDAAGKPVLTPFKELSIGDGTVEEWYADLDPRVRNLITAAYGVVHNPTDEEKADFLGSRSVHVG